MIINILFPGAFPRFGFGPFYPLVKWDKLFSQKKIKITFYHSHFEKRLLNCDILIIDWRYINLINKGHYSPNGFESKEDDFLKGLLIIAKEKSVKTILYDSIDPSGVRSFNILPYFDLCLKKQIFRNKERYTKVEGEHQIMTWLPDNIPELPRYKDKTLTLKEVQKIKLGWNIGLDDYRYFPGWFNKLPIANSTFFPKAYYSIKFTKPGKFRPYLFSYRGSIGKNKRYSYSRDKMLQVLENNRELIEGDFILGGKVSKNTYLNELGKSKCGLSPYGWGEICFRDFELMLNGALLLKPSVHHIQTWPDFFVENKTYIPLKWDYSDLIQKLIEINRNYMDYLEIAKEAQDKFMYFQRSGEEFFNHFTSRITS